MHKDVFILHFVLIYFYDYIGNFDKTDNSENTASSNEFQKRVSPSSSSEPNEDSSCDDERTNSNSYHSNKSLNKYSELPSWLFQSCS